MRLYADQKEMTTFPCPRCSTEIVLLQSRADVEMIPTDLDSVPEPAWFFKPEAGHRKHECSEPELFKK